MRQMDLMKEQARQREIQQANAFRKIIDKRDDYLQEIQREKREMQDAVKKIVAMVTAFSILTNIIYLRPSFLFGVDV